MTKKEATRRAMLAGMAAAILESPVLDELGKDHAVALLRSFVGGDVEAAV